MLNLIFVRNFASDEEMSEGCEYLLRDPSKLVDSDYKWLSGTRDAFKKGARALLPAIDRLGDLLLMEKDKVYFDLGFRLKTSVYLTPVFVFHRIFDLDPLKDKAKIELQKEFLLLAKKILVVKPDQIRGNFFNFSFRRDVGLALAYIDMNYKEPGAVGMMKRAKSWADKVAAEMASMN